MEINPAGNALSSEQARIVLENALDAVVGLSAENRVIEWNQQAEHIFGWTKAEAMGKVISDLIVPEPMRKAHDQGIARFIRTGESAILNRRIELEAVNKAGHRFPIELTVVPLLVNGSRLFYSFLRDITERKRTESALKEALRAKDEFIGICSHELKTPVTSLKLQFQLAAKQIRNGDPRAHLPEQNERRVAMANVQLDRMTKLIEDMLAASHLARGPLELRPEPLDLVGLGHEVLDRFADQFEAAATKLEYDPPGEVIMVRGDRFRLEQVITNLFTNAIKYGVRKPVRLSIGRSEERGRLTVIDQGVGIAPENKDRIFGAYERAASATNVTGLGLGLYISRQIAEAHGGQLSVESEPGRGSRFTLELPLLRG